MSTMFYLGIVLALGVLGAIVEAAFKRPILAGFFKISATGILLALIITTQIKVPTIGVSLIVCVICIWLGDFCLGLCGKIWKKDWITLAGTLLFLVGYGYLAYLLLPDFSSGGMVTITSVAVITILAIVGVIQYNSFDIPDIAMKIGVCVYTFIISFFFLSCTYTPSWQMILAALSLYFSDSVIAQSKYGKMKNLSASLVEYLITVPYYLGLFLLFGFLLQ